MPRAETASRWLHLDTHLFAMCTLVCVGLVMVGFLLGYAIEIPRALIPESARPDVSTFAQLRSAKTFWTIFVNNSRVFLLLIVGILTCGLLSIFEILATGAMVGFIYRFAMQQEIGLSLIAVALAPHGVLELASFLILTALGLYFGVRIYHSSKGELIDWLSEARAYSVTIAGAYVILTVAAITETYLTPLFVSKFLVR